MGSCVLWSDDGGADWSGPRRVPAAPPDSSGIADVGNNVRGILLAGGSLVILGYCQTSKPWERERDNPFRSFLLLSLARLRDPASRRRPSRRASPLAT